MCAYVCVYTGIYMHVGVCKGCMCMYEIYMLIYNSSVYMGYACVCIRVHVVVAGCTGMHVYGCIGMRCV